MSESSFKLGVCGLTHGHVWGLIQNFKDVPEIELVAVSDPTPLLDKAKGDFARSYKDWNDLLDSEKLDGIIVTSNNVESAEIATKALSMGIHCLVEKPMASTIEEAERMLKASTDSNTVLMINWPVAWNPALHELKSQIDQQTVGPIFYLKYRNGHFGPKEIGCDEYFYGWLYDEKLNGGGAIADFGSYGTAISRWMMGMPETVYAIKGNYTKDYPVPDDHAVITLKYPKGVAVLEGTWATFGFDRSANPVVHGKGGTIGVFGDQLEVMKGKERAEITPSPLPISGPAVYFLECIRTGSKPKGILDPEIALDGVRILAAAIRSTTTGCAEKP